MRQHSEWLLERRQHWYWEDLRFPATIVGVGANAPTWSTTEVGYEFDDNPPGNEEIQAIAQMPHSYVLGTAVHVHIHWYLTVAGGAGEDVKWDLLYRVAGIGGTFPAGWTTLESTVDVSAYGVREHLYTAWTAFDPAFTGVSGMIDLRVQRDTADAADDHANPVILKEVDIHFQRDTPGSYTETSKW